MTTNKQIALTSAERKQLELLATVDIVSVHRLMVNAPRKHRITLKLVGLGLVAKTADRLAWQITDLGRAALGTSASTQPAPAPDTNAATAQRIAARISTAILQINRLYGHLCSTDFHEQYDLYHAIIVDLHNIRNDGLKGFTVPTPHYSELEEAHQETLDSYEIVKRALNAVTAERDALRAELDGAS